MEVRERPQYNTWWNWSGCVRRVWHMKYLYLSIACTSSPLKYVGVCVWPQSTKFYTPASDHPTEQWQTVYLYSIKTVYSKLTNAKSLTQASQTLACTGCFETSLIYKSLFTEEHGKNRRHRMTNIYKGKKEKVNADWLKLIHLCTSKEITG